MLKFLKHLFRNYNYIYICIRNLNVEKISNRYKTWTDSRYTKPVSNKDEYILKICNLICYETAISRTQNTNLVFLKKKLDFIINNYNG